MIYEVCLSESERERLRLGSSFVYLDELDDFPDGIDRKAARRYVMDSISILQRFAGHGVGVYGWCTELDYHRKPVAFLYDHPRHGFIWIEIG